MQKRLKKYLVLLLYVGIIVIMLYELGKPVFFGFQKHPFLSEETQGAVWSLGVAVLGIFVFGSLPIILEVWEK